MSLNRERLHDHICKDQKKFHVGGWLLRVCTLTLALTMILSYLKDHNSSDEKKAQQDGGLFSYFFESKDPSDTEESEKRRPEIKIPVFRAQGQ